MKDFLAKPQEVNEASGPSGLAPQSGKDQGPPCLGIMGKSKRRNRFFAKTFWLREDRCLGGEQFEILINQGSTSDGMWDFDQSGFRGRVRREYLHAQKDNISGEAKQRASRK